MTDLLVALFGKPTGIVIAQLISATQFTIYLSLIAFAGGGALGAVMTVLATVRAKAARRVSAAYVWLFQSVPLLMLLFLLGFGVPRLLDIRIDPWLAAIVALTLYASAYLADVWRGAIEAVPLGQWDGARALGFRFPRILALIVLPQAFRLAIAPTVGFMVQIVKGTSLAYIIGFHDLMTVGKRWANAPVQDTEPFVIYPMMALIYFALCYPLSLYARRLEHRLGNVAKAPMPTAA
jgi:polar amino acid transport system permease protein